MSQKTPIKWFGRALALALIPILLTGCIGRKSSSSQSSGIAGQTEPVTLKIWRTFDSAEVFEPIIEEFERDNPAITLEYTLMSASEFELTTAEALAAGEGPDIWSIRNDWLPRHKNKLVPMPNGLLGKNSNQTDEDALKALFAPVVTQDVVYDGSIYGLPYYVDTLGIWKNTAVFNKKISELEDVDRDEEADLLRDPLNTYDKLQRAVELLTEKNPDGSISVSGLAAGTANNISRAEDVVYALMLQNGAEMVSPEHTNASFHLGVKNAVGQTVFKGTEALERFTGFADPAKSYYSWNTSMPGDVQAFIEGKAAMIFGFQYYELIFNQLAPTLKYSSIPLPQVRDIDTPVDYASYYIETVTKNTKNPTLAWEVLKNLVIERGNPYRSATKRPDPKPEEEPPTVLDRGESGNPFAYQQQTAKSWYKTKRPDKVDTIFRDLIQRVGTKSQAPQNAIEEAAQKISAILQGE
ncbi:extracellular solute-binding protein [Candidatus Berkelbacteria bacterium]|nr:extracellular solute-binding protein [Candidatus Berkelbacteria bacterium]